MKNRSIVGLAAAGATAVGLVAIPLVGTAAAATPYSSQGETVCFVDNCVTVNAAVAAGDRYTKGDSVAGTGRVGVFPVTDAANPTVSRVQIDSIVLGYQNGVLATAGAVNSGSTGVASNSTPGLLFAKSCSIQYHTRVNWSARLSNGKVEKGSFLSNYTKSPACAP